MENIQKEIKTDFDSLSRDVKNEVLKVGLGLDKLFGMLTNNDHNIKSGTSNNQVIANFGEENFLQKYNLPLNTPAEITSLDEEIRSNHILRSQLVSRLSQEAGTDGKADGSKVILKIVDILFGRKVLVNYSWTGVTRGENKESEKKVPFQSLDGILGVFFEVLLLADDRHTYQKNTSYFKDNVIKHARKRSDRKRVRKFFDAGDNAEEELDSTCRIKLDETTSENNDTVEDVNENQI